MNDSTGTKEERSGAAWCCLVTRVCSHNPILHPSSAAVRVWLVEEHIKLWIIPARDNECTSGCSVSDFVLHFAHWAIRNVFLVCVFQLIIPIPSLPLRTVFSVYVLYEDDIVFLMKLVKIFIFKNWKTNNHEHRNNPFIWINAHLFVPTCKCLSAFL